MAQSNKLAGKVMGAILAVVIAGIMLGYVFPVGITAASEDATTSLNQSNQTQVEVTTNLVSNVTDANFESDATIKLEDTETGDTTTITVNENSNQTVSFTDGDITVRVDDAKSDSADITYNYPNDYGWEDGASSIFSVLPIFMVLVPLGVLAAYVMRSM